MASQTPTSSAKLNCLCGAITLPGTYLKDKEFPIPSSLCHCNPCRYTSGGLIPAFADLTGPPPQEVKDKLVAYQFTEFCIRYFCSTCGSHCFVEHPHKPNEWYCPTGIIDPPPNTPNATTLTGHTYISDTKDASIIPILLPITSQREDLYATAYGEQKIIPYDLFTMAQEATRVPSPSEHETLTAKCHCGGVDLQIKRADYVHEPEGVRSLMSPDHPHRYLARFCACRSCRLSMGFSLCPWAYTSLPAVLNSKPHQPIVFGARAEEPNANEGLSLKHYQSSEGTWRSFCTGCGASVFYYTVGEGRDDVVDVAVGLLRAGSGSLAGEWVEWAVGEVSYAEEGTDRGMVEVVEGWNWSGIRRSGEDISCVALVPKRSSVLDV